MTTNVGDFVYRKHEMALRKRASSEGGSLYEHARHGKRLRRAEPDGARMRSVEAGFEVAAVEGMLLQHGVEQEIIKIKEFRALFRHIGKNS